MDPDRPLDFESEDLLLRSPAPTKRRKKVIGLDDLVNDYLKENKKLEMKSKQTTARKNYFPDEDEDIREAKLTECVEKVQKEMGQISGEEEISLWGLQVFGNQKSLPQLPFHELGSCGILQSFMDNELNSLVELDIEKGEVFLERLLVNGWLLKLLHTCGHVEISIATWTFNLMLYSGQEVLSASACDFWTSILSPNTKIKIDWLPKYSDLKRALEMYGFRSDLAFMFSSSVEMVSSDSDNGGPPQNIIAWIKYVAACSQVRKYTIISISDAEELVVVLIYLFLDRQLLGLSVILHECMLSVINFFTDNEWSTSCEKVAKCIACRVPKDVNCLRAVESISGVDARSKHLRHAVAFQILVACLDIKAADAEEIMRFLFSINVKDKSCDFFKMYIYIVLTENWLLYNPMLEDKPVIHERSVVKLLIFYKEPTTNEHVLSSTVTSSYHNNVSGGSTWVVQEEKQFKLQTCNIRPGWGGYLGSLLLDEFGSEFFEF